MQQRLGLATGLRHAFEHEVIRGLVGHGGFEVTCNGLVGGVTRVLRVHARSGRCPLPSNTDPLPRALSPG